MHARRHAERRRRHARLSSRARPPRRTRSDVTAAPARVARRRARAAQVAHHAQEAHAMRDLVAYSLRAADEAAALGAHREVVQHLARALEHGTWLTNAERADLLERQAQIGELCGAFELAVRAVEEA